MICWKIGKVTVGTHCWSSDLWTRQFGERQLLFSSGEDDIGFRGADHQEYVHLIAHMARMSSLNKMDWKTETVL